MYHTMIEHQREENREKGYTCFVLPTENMMHPIEKKNIQQYNSVQDQIYISVQPSPTQIKKRRYSPNIMYICGIEENRE